MEEAKKCRYCGCLPKVEYFPGIMQWRVICPTVGCVNHRRHFPLESSPDGAVISWNRHSVRKRKPFAEAQTFELYGMLDRRRKLTDAEKAEIRRLYALGGISHNGLAHKFHVSKSLIGYIVNPERAARVRERQKAHWKEQAERRGKDYHAKMVRQTRRYKYDLYRKGVIGKEG